MDCLEIKKRLPDIIDDSPGDLESPIREHLSSCASCAGELRRLQEGWELLSAWKDIEPSPGLKDRVWKDIARGESSGTYRKRTPSRWRPSWVTLGSLAAAALLLVSIWVLWPSWKKERSLEESRGITPLSEFLAIEEVLEEKELLADMELLENLDILLALEEMSHIPDKEG
jgi:hypothetical protein